MKIHTLHEGLIKIPKPLLQTATRFVRAAYLNELSKKINDPDSLHAMEDVLGVSPTSDRDTILSYSPKVVDQRYHTGRHTPKKIRLSVVNIQEADGVDWDGEHYDERTSRIRINLKNFLKPQIISRIKRTPESVLDFVHHLDSNVEHELTHAIQAKYLAHKDIKHAGNVDHIKDDGSFDREGYYNSDLEFSSTIRSEVGKFKRAIARHGRYSDQDVRRELLRAWIDPDYNGDAKINVDGTELPMKATGRYLQLPSEFFATLKKTNLQKWKKAVKYFIDSLNTSN